MGKIITACTVVPAVVKANSQSNNKGKFKIQPMRLRTP